MLENGIVGLTHDTNGNPIMHLAVTKKISIGRPAGFQGSKAPKKEDHFIFQTKNGRAEWIDDEELVRHFGTDCRELDIFLLWDDPDKNFKVSYQLWTASFCACSGNGKVALRKFELKELSDGTKVPVTQTVSINGRKTEVLTRVEPYEAACPCEFLEQVSMRKEIKGEKSESLLCKPVGTLYFVLKDFPSLGSLCKITTTSRRSIQQIYSAMIQILNLTRGRLAGIPLKLVVKPEVAFPEVDGRPVRSTIYTLHLEFRGFGERTHILEELFKASLTYSPDALYSKTVKELHVEVDEEETAKEMTQEFYCQNSNKNGQVIYVTPESQETAQEETASHREPEQTSDKPGEIQPEPGIQTEQFSLNLF